MVWKLIENIFTLVVGIEIYIFILTGVETRWINLTDSVKYFVVCIFKFIPPRRRLLGEIDRKIRKWYCNEEKIFIF